MGEKCEKYILGIMWEAFRACLVAALAWALSLRQIDLAAGERNRTREIDAWVRRGSQGGIQTRP